MTFEGFFYLFFRPLKIPYLNFFAQIVFGAKLFQLHISKNGGRSYKLLNSYKDVKAFYWLVNL